MAPLSFVPSDEEEEEEDNPQHPSSPSSEPPLEDQDSEEQQQQQQQQQDSDDDDDGDSEAEETQVIPTQLSSLITTKEDEDSKESQSEDEQQQQPPKKKTDDEPEPKPKPKPKRRLDDDKNSSKPNKKPKTDINNKEVKKPGGGFPRLWSEDDEIALLKAVIDFQSNPAIDVTTHQPQFYGFVKKSLHVNVNLKQVIDKVRKLKKKFHINLDKNLSVFPKSHDNTCFQLSRQIWGDLSHDKTHNVDDVPAPSANEKAVQKIREEIKEEDDDFANLYPFLMAQLCSDSSVLIHTLKNSLRRFAHSSKLEELNNKWKDIYVTESELSLRKISLKQEQTKLLLDAIKSD